MPIKKASYISSVFIALCALAISPATASLAITGAMFNTDAAPGEHISHELNVSLSSDEPASVNMATDLMDWYQYPNGLSIGIKDSPDITPYSAKNFLSVSPATFTLSPGSHQKVEIKGDMPSGDGCKYAVVFVHTVPKAAKEGTGVAISFGMNTMVLLTISGSKLIKTGEIDNLSFEEPISSKQQNLTMIFKNTGNYHYKVNASAFLKDEKGDILSSDSHNTKESIIPTARRIISFSIVPKSELTPGNYSVEAKVTLADGTVLATKETGFEIKP